LAHNRRLCGHTKEVIGYMSQKTVSKDPVGYPDFTRPVSIIGYTITSLPIDIVAQTLGVVKIDIVAQTLSQLNVNIAAQAVTINVATAVGEHVDTDIISSVQIDVNIAASAVTLNIAIVSPIDAVTGYVQIDIVAQSVGNLAVNIAAQAVTVNVATASIGNLAVNIAAQAVTVNVATAVGEHVDTDIISSVQIDVNIAASAITLNVDIAAQTLPQLNINIAASAITLNVQTAVGEHVDADIVSSITIGVDIVAQTVGNIAIDIAAQSLTNVAVNIAAQAVDLNIRTSGGANIVIDKLTQTAYTERRSILRNDGGARVGTNPTGDQRVGKFFPRGARGFIHQIQVETRDIGTSGGTCTVYLAPYIGAGYLYSGTFTIPAGGGFAFRTVDINVMWNYDALFIFAVLSQPELRITYDKNMPYDHYWSNDAGASWTHFDGRPWIRVVHKGETVGDLPVSGTLNTISVPNLATGASSGVRSVAAGATETLLTIDGGGKNIALWLWSAHDEPRFSVELDGEKIRFILYDYIDAHDANYFGFAGDTPLIQLIKFTDFGECLIQVNIPFEWTRKCVIYGYNPTTAVQNMRADFNYLRIT